MSEETTQQISEEGSTVDTLSFDDSRLRTCHSDEECGNVVGKDIPPELLKELDDSEEEEKKKKKKRIKKSDKKDVNAQSGNVLGKEIPPELLKEFEDSDEEPKKKKRSRSKAGRNLPANYKVCSNKDKIPEEKNMKKKEADNAVAKPCSDTGIEKARKLAVRQRNSITRRIKTKEQKRKSISSKKARKRQSLRQGSERNTQQKNSASKV
ncbi:unnamed protein product [Cylicocyclus nassatus]|uniref:Uncharacterized protein n=1 Tax=Cylicocyclus nassatus TaxID=53992 RepID=A0AA36DSD1_CYLNA|nr:unnamed protein product [Cylicocyclus nassatus]